MAWIGIEQSCTPTAKASVVNAVMFHVNGKFLAQECGRFAWLVVHNLLVCVVRCVGAHVWKFILKPRC
jgi:hypothetical protein